MELLWVYIIWFRPINVLFHVNFCMLLKNENTAASIIFKTLLNSLMF